MGAWNRGKLQLLVPPDVSISANVAAKIEAVANIVAIEWNNLGDALRLVVLTDYIYPELLLQRNTTKRPLQR
ncbi:MAG: hypothetical protein R2795_22550 [Saprospiraceae bacterium]